jgi:hypothetical protein
MGLSDNPLCLACGLEEETAFHFMCGCPAFSIARTLARGSLPVELEQMSEKNQKNPLNDIQIQGLHIRPELRHACMSLPRLHPPKSIHPSLKWSLLFSSIVGLIFAKWKNTVFLENRQFNLKSKHPKF